MFAPTHAFLIDSCIFDQSMENGDKSWKNQGISIYCASGNPVNVVLLIK